MSLWRERAVRGVNVFLSKDSRRGAFSRPESEKRLVARKRETEAACAAGVTKKVELLQEEKENGRRNWYVNRCRLASWPSLIFCGSGV